MQAGRHAVVRSVKVYMRDERLRVMTLRGVAFRAVDRDEWRGPIRTSFRAARADALARNLAEHNQAA